MQALWLRRSGNWIEQHPLLFALGVSLAVHVVLFCVAGTLLGIALLRDPELLKQIAQSPEKIIELTAQKFESATPRELKPPEPEKQMPMLFIEVDPAQSAADTPKNAKYYSAQNTLAANPDTKLDTEQPKVDGKQTQIIRAFDATRSQTKPQPLQPSPQTQARVEAQPQKQAQTAQNQARQQNSNPAERAKQERGDLEKLRPVQKTDPAQLTEENPQRGRPKTIAEAKMRENSSRPPGERMKQDGGTKRFADVASLEAVGTPLGNYDAMIIEAIRSKWYALLEETQHAGDRKGHVVIVFRIYSNGTVRNVRTDEEDVGDLLSYLCQSAVLTPAPYKKWPEEVRAAVGKDYRDVKFTFFYN